VITGIVNARRDALITIEIEDSDGGRHEIDAVIDTGFNRFLMLPMTVIDSLGLRRLFRERAELGDGSIRLLSVYRAFLYWDGARRKVDVHAADAGSAFVGMALLDGYEVRIQVAKGGTVTIEAMP
jgi:clan AA aspartic protease